MASTSSPSWLLWRKSSCQPWRAHACRHSACTSAKVALPYTAGSRVPSKLRLGPLKTQTVSEPGDDGLEIMTAPVPIKRIAPNAAASGNPTPHDPVNAGRCPAIRPDPRSGRNPRPPCPAPSPRMLPHAHHEWSGANRARCPPADGCRRAPHAPDRCR